MTLRLKDIIDLEYLAGMDEDPDTPDQARACHVRDRDIYTRIGGDSLDKKSLLSGWLAQRKRQYLNDTEKKGFSVLPGTIFSTLYHAMIYAMVGAGLFSGVSLVISFLAYHGNRPVNVTLFVAVFVLLPLVLALLSALFGFRRLVSGQGASGASALSGVHSFLSALMFKGLPRLLQKLDWELFKKSRDTIETMALIIRMKKQHYQGMFFWPFFNLTSLFSISFSFGAFLGTFFRVMVSDMAFGWQSTILTSSETVHVIVSGMARPWAGWVPVSMAHPGPAQIEGSRIVLKDGISVLATQDLISWWPFLCLSVFFYAVLPRGILIVTALAAQTRILNNFDLNLPVFNDLTARMQSPVLSVETLETPVSHAIEENPIKQMDTVPQFLDDPVAKGRPVVVLLSRTAYAGDAEKKVLQAIEADLFYQVKQRLGISFNFDTDAPVIKELDFNDIAQVVLVQEVWQPPIRGLLFFITALAKALPGELPVLVFLTGDAGQSDLAVDADDINYEIWKKAVFKLANPKISVKRFIRHDS